MAIYDLHGQPISTARQGITSTATSKGGASLLELGVPGTDALGGFFNEEKNPALTGRRRWDTFKAMGFDPTVAMALKVLELPLRAADWHVDPADETDDAITYADFCHYSLYEFGASGTQSTWDDCLRLAINGRNQYGFELSEIVYRLDDDRYPGLVCWDKFAHRSQWTIYKFNFEEVDTPDGGRLRKLVSVTQWAPPTYQHTVIPSDKFLLWVRDLQGEYMEGFPVTRAMFKPWWIRDRLYAIQMVGLERSYMGMPIGILPLLYTDEMKTLMKNIVQGLRTHEHAGAVIREDMKLEVLHNQLQGDTMAKAIEWLTYEIVRSVLAQFTMLGSNTVGSFALAQPYSSSVLTPQGFVPMGELGVGDRVVDALGGVQRIKAIQERGELEVYEMHFGDGRVVECSADHRWAVTTSHWKRKGVPRGRRGQRLRILHHGSPLELPEPFDPLFGYGVLTAAEIKNRLESSSISRTGLAVPPVQPVDYDEASSLPIDPYLLGLLLGDGSLGKVGVHHAPVLTTADAEVVAAVRELVPMARVKAKPESRAVNVVLSRGRSGGSNPWAVSLDELGLSGHRAWEKFIPEAYQYASVRDRVALLQGLMDTDGTSANGQVIFGTTSPRLAVDVERLVRGLGATSVHRRIRPIAGPLARHETYVVDFDCIGCEPFRLPRKLAKYRPKTCTQGNKIVKVVATGRKTRMRCISITGASHLYLTDGFLPTHNSVDQSDLFLMGLNADANYLAEVINLDPGIPTLLRFNYPKIKVSQMPKLIHGNVGQRNFDRIMRGLAMLIQWGGIVPDDTMEDALREMIGLPEREGTVTPEYLKDLLVGMVPERERVDPRTHLPRPAAPGAKGGGGGGGGGAAGGNGGGGFAEWSRWSQYQDARARMPWQRPKGRLDQGDRIKLAAAEELFGLAEDLKRPAAKPERPSVRVGKAKRPYRVVRLAETERQEQAQEVSGRLALQQRHRQALQRFFTTLGERKARENVPIPPDAKLPVIFEESGNGVVGPAATLSSDD